MCRKPECLNIISQWKVNMTNEGSIKCNTVITLILLLRISYLFKCVKRVNTINTIIVSNVFIHRTRSWAHHSESTLSKNSGQWTHNSPCHLQYNIKRVLSLLAKQSLLTNHCFYTNKGILMVIMQTFFGKTEMTASVEENKLKHTRGWKWTILMLNKTKQCAIFWHTLPLTKRQTDIKQEKE